MFVEPFPVSRDDLYSCSPVTLSGLEGGCGNVTVMREMPTHLYSRVG